METAGRHHTPGIIQQGLAHLGTPRIERYGL